MLHLDFRTATILYFCTNLCIAAMLAVAFSSGQVRGTRLWIAGMGIQLASAPLFLLRGVIADSLSIFLGNLLFTLAWSCYLASLDRFFGNRRKLWVYALPLVLAAAVCGAFMHDARTRTVLLNILYAAQCLALAAVILAQWGRFRRRFISTFAMGYVLATGACLLRALAIVQSTGSTPDPFGPGPAQTASLLLSVPSLVACTLGFVLLHRERMEAEIRRLAEIDHLTGLTNRRGFEAGFAKALAQAAVNHSWTSLALIDLDRFKAINDRLGHAAGDVVLVELGRILTREMGPDDLLARIGGDEFCVVMPRTPPEPAAALAERLRRAVAGHDWQAYGLPQPLTATIGLSSHRGSRQDGGADFLRLADMALLAAKDEARNTIRQAQSPASCPAKP
ncbi:GAF domain/GGDEF domain protein [Desulfovibrio sp. DV]|uniref:GGDEF domain-containing protein n=1 Tax=Desulfovibrio sp. DV TaxID=1844708 RepID=UPI00094B82CA|nr:GGDEF domain-containing protein [Desulfovibrio sp. DV]OLN25451.1 GAF domain/GGDEF domain protein [Desulfovibrio sp. DV]